MTSYLLPFKNLQLTSKIAKSMFRARVEPTSATSTTTTNLKDEVCSGPPGFGFLLTGHGLSGLVRLGKDTERQLPTSRDCPGIQPKL